MTLMAQPSSRSSLCRALLVGRCHLQPPGHQSPRQRTRQLTLSLPGGQLEFCGGNAHAVPRRVVPRCRAWGQAGVRARTRPQDRGPPGQAPGEAPMGPQLPATVASRPLPGRLLPRNTAPRKGQAVSASRGATEADSWKTGPHSPQGAPQGQLIAGKVPGAGGAGRMGPGSPSGRSWWPLCWGRGRGERRRARRPEGQGPLQAAGLRGPPGCLVWAVGAGS